MTSQSHTPLVSIVVPNYNYARYLKERMESVYNQTITDYEIILLDDASTDESASLLKEYAKDPRVASLVINEVNTGLPFLQWKRGIEMARGKYVWIAESDDKAAPDFLEACVSALEANPDAVIAFAGSTTIDSEGKPGILDYDDWTDPRHIERIGQTIIHDGEKFATHNMAWKNYVYNASDTVFRRSAFDGDPDFDACFRMRNTGDHLFWTIMMKKGKVIEIYRKLNFFRRHQTSQTAVGATKRTVAGDLFDEDIDVRKYIFDNFPMGATRKTILRGNMIKSIKRSEMSPADKKRAMRLAAEKLGASQSDYCFDRVYKFFWNLIPGLISMRNDRL